MAKMRLGIGSAPRGSGRVSKCHPSYNRARITVGRHYSNVLRYIKGDVYATPDGRAILYLDYTKETQPVVMFDGKRTQNYGLALNKTKPTHGRFACL